MRLSDPISQILGGMGATFILIAGATLFLDTHPASCQESGRCVSGLECSRDSECGAPPCVCIGASPPFNKLGVCATEPEGVPIPDSPPLPPLTPPRQPDRKEPVPPSPEPVPDVRNPDCSNPLPNDPRCQT